MSIRVEIKHENDNRQEYGYGIYVNGYVEDDEFIDAPMGLYASECVPFSRNTPKYIKKAEHRVRQNARNAYRREWMQDRHLA